MYALCLLLSGVAEGVSTKVAAAKSVKKEKSTFVRRRSSDGFSMLLNNQSRLENLYNQTLRTQVQFDVSFLSIFHLWLQTTVRTRGAGEWPDTFPGWMV